MLSNNFVDACNLIQSNFISKILFSSIDYLQDNFLVVADTNTSHFLNDNHQKVIFSGDVLPTLENVEHIRSHNYQTLISLGSGTINDLCKYASFLDGKKFITIPTAPSVNGYTSNTASIIVDNLKQSYQAHLPEKIYLCLDILINAPMRLIISGFSEIICKYTTQPDWLLSHLLLGTSYTDLPFRAILDLKHYLIKNRDSIIKRNPEAIQILMEALILSGLGMNFAGGSYPASQGEHQIVHTMEMNNSGHKYFHGEKVAVATVSMLKLQNFIVRNELQSSPIHMDKVIEEYYGDCAAEHIEIMHRKRANINLQSWSHTKDSLIKIISNTEEIESMLTDVGSPTCCKDLDWESEKYEKACWVASASRDRFTFLDLLPYSSHADKFSFSE